MLSASLLSRIDKSVLPLWPSRQDFADHSDAFDDFFVPVLSNALPCRINEIATFESLDEKLDAVIDDLENVKDQWDAENEAKSVANVQAFVYRFDVARRENHDADYGQTHEHLVSRGYETSVISFSDAIIDSC